MADRTLLALIVALTALSLVLADLASAAIPYRAEVTFAWPASSGPVTGYHVTASTDGVSMVTADVVVPTVKLPVPTGGARYVVRVVPFGAAGAVGPGSDPSEELTILALATPTVPPVAGVARLNIGPVAMFRWQAASGGIDGHELWLTSGTAAPILYARVSCVSGMCNAAVSRPYGTTAKATVRGTRGAERGPFSDASPDVTWKGPALDVNGDGVVGIAELGNAVGAFGSYECGRERRAEACQ